MSRHIKADAASFDTLTDARSTYLRAGFAVAVLTALTAFAARAGAQSASHDATFELRPVVGAFIPTGDHRDLLKDAVLVGAQASYRFTPHLAAVGTFAWSPSEDRTTAASEKVDLFQYDLGIEGRIGNLTRGSRVSTSPYATLGVGGRTYDYRDLPNADAQTNFLGYGAIGLDVAPATGPIGLRIEARDNISAFRGLRGELAESKARNDLQFSGGLTFRF